MDATYDQDYEDWKAGDLICWKEDKTRTWPIQFIHKTEVHWTAEDDSHQWTMYYNIYRVQTIQEKREKIQAILTEFIRRLCIHDKEFGTYYSYYLSDAQLDLKILAQLLGQSISYVQTKEYEDAKEKG